MPDVYPGGQHIPAFDGATLGGVTVAVHRPEDVERLIALCELAAKPPEESLHAIVKALAAEPLNLGAWHELRARRTTEGQPESPKREPDDADDLIEALTVAGEIWRAQGDEIQQLTLTLTIADPATIFYPNLSFLGSRVALVFRKGSLETLVLSLPFKAVFYAVCLVFGEGAISPSARAASLAKRLREKARSKGAKDLRPLHEITPDGLKGEGQGLKNLVVFVHGLFSTDIGVFDRLIDRLEGNQDLLCAGFPHDSLAEVEVNGNDLAKLIDSLVYPPGIPPGPQQPMVLFVCHSRGGLVARSAAVKLQDTRNRNSGDYIVGCVTFGTPHRGASLAEQPNVFLGMATVLMQLNGSASFASLIDILCVYESSGNTIPGIQDLRTPEGGGKFIKKLEDLERELSGYFRPKLDILAIGGHVPPSRPGAKLMTRLLATAEHDLIVPVGSSIPQKWPQERKAPTDCDHVHYFDDCQEKILDQVVKYIDDRFRERSAHPFGSRAAPR
jgi:pimeloyl-ACP methyl ester carboxylesterase